MTETLAEENQRPARCRERTADIIAYCQSKIRLSSLLVLSNRQSAILVSVYRAEAALIVRDGGNPGHSRDRSRPIHLLCLPKHNQCPTRHSLLLL